MKTRFFGTVLVLAILAALFIATEEVHTNPGAVAPTTQPNDTGLQPLKIN